MMGNLIRLAAVAWTAASAALALLHYSAVSEPLAATGFLPAWLDAFALLQWPLGAVLALGMAWALGRGGAAFLPAACAAGIGALWTPAAPWLAWMPLLAWESLLLPRRPRHSESGGGASFAAALSVFVIFSLRPGAEAIGVTWSLLTHLLAAAAFSLAWQFFGFAALGAVIFFLLLKIGLAALAVSGPLAWSLAAPAALALALAARNARPLPLWTWFPTALTAFGASFLLSDFDWGHTLRMLNAAAAAAVFFLVFLPFKPLPAPPARATAALIACAWLWIGAAKTFSPTWALAGSRLPDVVAAQADRDASFRLLRTLFSPRLGDPSLYETLARHTNLPPATPLRPPPLEFRAPAKTPDTYIFMIDSLRRDYIGAYNPTVRFTPHFDAFARGEFAYPKAFTAYAGTALSEQAFWAGSLLPHIQSIRPFAPFDRLSPYLKAGKYRRWISRDVYLRGMLKEEPEDADLDAGSIGDYRFCRTLREIQSRLEKNPAGPLFVYTRPEDLHISILKREGNTVEKGAPLDGFYPPYASRVARIDACFGEFIAALKRLGRYEQSRIVVTADHGELLGEQHGWGHAYALTPSIVRVPLLSKGLPKTDAPVFVHDIPALLDDSFAAAPGPRLVASTFVPLYGLIKDGGRVLHVADAVNQESRAMILDDETHIDPDPADDAEILRLLDALQKKFGYR